MNTPISKTWTGAIITIAVSIAPILGYEVYDAASFENFVLVAVGFFIAADRVLKGDISWFGLRKKN